MSFSTKTRRSVDNQTTCECFLTLYTRDHNLRENPYHTPVQELKLPCDKVIDFLSKLYRRGNQNHTYTVRYTARKGNDTLQTDLEEGIVNSVALLRLFNENSNYQPKEK